MFCTVMKQKREGGGGGVPRDETRHTSETTRINMIILISVKESKIDGKGRVHNGLGSVS